ncbi:hypothetical protein MAR_033564 [Mya arenaria]|uniref:Uncharacterized protein n=1 Tax=Mya arenaria TaxID=6604 RepID=A0ABY7GAS1_MYAAR|nr:hypothetical protein MAR_033564 [Mya arenaria]
MEDDFETSIDIDVEQANEENRRREITLHDEVPGRMPLANQMFHETANWSATGDIASGIVSSSDIAGCKNGYTRGQICMDDCSQCCGICMRDLRVKVAAFCGGIGDALCQCANGICKGLSLLATGTCTGVSLLGQCLYGICSVQRANWSAIGDIASGIVSSSDIDRVSHPSNTNETSEPGAKTDTPEDKFVWTTVRNVAVAAFCGGIGDALCQCANGICKGLSLLATGTCTGVSLLGQCLYGICSVQWLLHLFLPLCSMSIAISSVVLPYWAWGETDDVAVGLFKCCNFTEKNRNSTISECSPLSDCFPSESSKFLGIDLSNKRFFLCT